jgi:hypothetical protein
LTCAARVGLLGAMSAEVQNERCEDCGRHMPAYEMIHLTLSETQSRRVCTRCFNTRIAGVDFEHPNFEPVMLKDASGMSHEFHFTTRHGGAHLAVEAFEVEDGHPAGYQFQVLGDPEEEPLAIFLQLFERMRRALARRHIENGDLGSQIAKSGEGWVLRGQIDWDEDEDGRVPRLVVDGNSYTWDEIGRMLMAFEGFQVKMEVHDKSEER